MKRIAILILSAIVIIGGSCKKLMEETPYSTVTTVNFYKSAADAELAITGVYDVLNTQNIQGLGNQSLWGWGMHYMTNLGVDDLTEDIRFVTANPEYLAFYNYTYTPDNIAIWYSYFFLYAGINRANFIIEKVPSINMNADRRSQIIGEAKFFRGMFYSYLGWLWGGVPLITGTAPDISSPRSSLQAVLKQAETDLKDAYNALPVRNAIPGRVNKYTAAGFLVKNYLYQASCKQNNVGKSLNFPLNSFDWVNVSEAYNQALTTARDIYNNSGYRLIRPYNQLFLSATEEAARNENMMIVQAGPGGSQEYVLFAYLAGPRGNYRTNSGTYGWLRPVRECYQKFNSNDGRLSSLSGYLNTTTLSTTINNYKYYTPDAILSNLSNLCVNKWREDDPNAKLLRGIPAYAGEADYAILRFADVVLMYAEAMYQTGDEAGARALLRELRLRGCADDITKTNVVTAAYLKTDFMAELLDERERELLAEGWRRMDLIRTGKIAGVVSSLSTSIMFTGQETTSIKENFRDYKIWYPIPGRDTATNVNLIQNPGY